jgi:hypothetical protein
MPSDRDMRCWRAGFVLAAMRKGGAGERSGLLIHWLRVSVDLRS